MLFHVTHHHTEATCPAHGDEVAGNTRSGSIYWIE